MAKDFYNVLGVEKNATDDELKSAYRKMAKQYHPDINKSPEAEAKFKEANEAYSVLSDSAKRSNYDKFGTAEPGGFGGGGAGGGQGFGGFSNAGGFDFGFGGFEDLFSGMFGGGASSTRTRETVGSDINVRINLSFQESVFGCKKQVSVTRTKQCSACHGSGARSSSDVETCKTCGGSGQIRQMQSTLFGKMSTITTCSTCGGSGKIIKNPCSACNGKGLVRTSETIDVDVPAGIDNGQVMTYSGKGETSKTGHAGDLNIQITTHEHPLLKRKGNDLYVTVNVPYLTCVLGGDVRVPLTKGTLNFTIPECTQSGKVFKEKGKGVKILNKNSYGDLYITVVAEFPRNLSKDDKRALQELSERLTPSSYEKNKQYNDTINQL